MDVLRQGSLLISRLQNLFPLLAAVQLAAKVVSRSSKQLMRSLVREGSAIDFTVQAPVRVTLFVIIHHEP